MITTFRSNSKHFFKNYHFALSEGISPPANCLREQAGTPIHRSIPDIGSRKATFILDTLFFISLP
ncbi:hypothetical protein ES705_34680 [subsurface metagenome]